MAVRLPYLCPAASNPLIIASYRALVRTAAAIGLIRLEPFLDLEQMVAHAAGWVEQRGRGPVFMWVHFFPPHDPYAAPEPWLGRFDHSPAARNALNVNPANASSSTPQGLFDMALEPVSRINTLEARYDESIAYVDHYIGQLIRVVRQNLGPNTAILLTADHGESFDHGYGEHTGPMLYEDLIHIPLIIELPNPPATGERRSDLAAQIDLAPTIAAIAEVSRY
jgi:arylsulfatase A-like enzyme